MGDPLGRPRSRGVLARLSTAATRWSVAYVASSVPSRTRPAASCGQHGSLPWRRSCGRSASGRRTPPRLVYPPGRERIAVARSRPPAWQDRF